MRIIRCLICNKVLGEVEGKAKIKCKMAGCHCMNVIDTDAGTQFEQAKWAEPDKEIKWIIGSNPDSTFDEDVEKYKAIHKDENDTNQRIMQQNIDLLNGDWQKHFKPYEIK